jgi:hypothetical protein
VFRGKTFKHPYQNSADTAYPEKTIARILGFGINNYVSAVQVTGDAFTNVIYSEFKKNFNQENYTVLKIELLDINISTSDTLKDSFVIITDKLIGGSISKDLGINKLFNPHLGKLNKIKINFYDYYGNPFDFQNRDHRLEFIVKCDSHY